MSDTKTECPICKACTLVTTFENAACFGIVLRDTVDPVKLSVIICDRHTVLLSEYYLIMAELEVQDELEKVKEVSPQVPVLKSPEPIIKKSKKDFN